MKKKQPAAAEQPAAIHQRPTQIPPGPPPSPSKFPVRVAPAPRRATEIGFEYGDLLRERPAPTDEQWARIEARVGAALPADYKVFLATQNGGRPLLPWVPIGEEGFWVECLNYVDGAEADSYDVEKASRWPSEGIGEEVVAIAPDGGGDQLILRRVDGDWRVEWWHHDAADPGATEPVAASFSALLDLLEPDPNDD